MIVSGVPLLRFQVFNPKSEIRRLDFARRDNFSILFWFNPKSSPPTIPGTAPMYRAPSFLIALLIGAAALSCMSFIGCTPGLVHTQVVPCSRPRAEVMDEAKRTLQAAGFQMRMFLADSGYLRTSAKSIQTVNEISSGRPTMIFVEAQHTPAGLNVNAFRLVAKQGSVSARSGALDEESADTEEIPLEPGNRLFIFHVGPFLDKMTEFCAGK